MNELVFRPFLPEFLLKNALLLGIGAYCAFLSARSGHSWWLIGTALAGWLDLLVVCRYNTQVILIHGATLICRRGTLRIRESSFPLVRVDLEIDQSLLGRLMDFGTVRLLAGNDIIVLRQIAFVSKLQAIIAKRQMETTLLQRVARSMQEPYTTLLPGSSLGSDTISKVAHAQSQPAPHQLPSSVENTNKRRYRVLVEESDILTNADGYVVTSGAYAIITLKSSLADDLKRLGEAALRKYLTPLHKPGMYFWSLTDDETKDEASTPPTELHVVA